MRSRIDRRGARCGPRASPGDACRAAPRPAGRRWRRARPRRGCAPPRWPGRRRRRRRWPRAVRRGRLVERRADSAQARWPRGRRHRRPGRRPPRRARPEPRAGARAPPPARRGEPTSASARTLSRSCAARMAVSRPHSAVRSRSRSARRSSISVRRAATLASSASTSWRASRAFAAAALRAGELGAVGVQLAGQEPAAQLGGLALEARVDVRGLRLALQRAQAAARLAFDVERPVEVVLRALELQLRPAAALAVLAEAGRLLDQQTALARPGVDDLLHAALADHRVHLVAEVRVRQRLDHVDQPAARAVQPVLAVAVPLQPAPDRQSQKSPPAAQLPQAPLALAYGSRFPHAVPRPRRRGRMRDDRSRGPPRPRRSGAGTSPSPPAKIMSCIVWPRTASGLCSPSAQSTASVMLDLPQPLGPTMTLTPGENSSRVRSGNDLNPLIVIELRCTGSGRLSVSSDVISAAWL